MIAYAFCSLNVNRVEIRAEPSNTRSRAVAERLGFTMEGILRQVVNMGDRFADRAVYSLLREEWQDNGKRLAFSFPLTKDAELRLLLPHYAEEIFAVTDKNRARLRPYMPWVEGTTCAEHTRSFINRALQCMANKTEIQWGIWYCGRCAGTIGTLPIDYSHKKAEFGYWLGEEFQGKGLMTAAGKAMLACLFNVLDLNRAELSIRTTNTRSRAVAGRLGFCLESIQRQAIWSEGKPVDMACYALLRQDWKK
jgi:ribosomal-protein-serine acetyltransferase